MRKKSLARLLALAMAVALLSTTALAYVGINQDFIDNAKVTTETENNNTYTYIDLENDDYKLIDDISTSHSLRFTGDSENPAAAASLDLNGKTITYTGDKDSIVSVMDGAKLTLEDSSGKDEETGEYVSAGTGVITGAKGAGAITVVNSEFTMKGGNITGNTGGVGNYRYKGINEIINGVYIQSRNSGGGVSVYNGTFIMDGGNIKDNHYECGGTGAGGVYAYHSTVEINGGSIQNNTGGSGPVNASAILLGYGSTLTMTDGIISGNTGGHGIIALYDDGTNTATINGGKIINNQGSTWGRYSLNALTISDKAIICSNSGNGDEVHTHDKPATCTTPQTCSYCNDITGEALGHNVVDDAAVAATCTSTGLTAGQHCTRCDDMTVAQIEIPATGHAWDSGVVTTAPDYSIPGVRTYTCTVCGDTYTAPIVALVAVVFGEQTTGTGTGDSTGTDIANDLIPLAGIVTEAQLLDALYQHEDAPEVELVEKYADHEYAPAISWALANGIVVEDEFDPDEVVTVAILRDVLTAYVEYKAIDFTVVVDGEDDEIVMDLGERLTVFFAELDK